MLIIRYSAFSNHASLTIYCEIYYFYIR